MSSRMLFIVLFRCILRAHATRHDRLSPIGTASYAGRDFFKEPFTADSPCVYPSPHPNKTAFKYACKLPIDQINRHNICDANGNAVSFTEANELAIQLDSIILEKVDKGRERQRSCICDPDRPQLKNEYCWYKFGFAFLSKLELPKYELPDGINADELCWKGNFTHPVTFVPVPPRRTQHWTRQMVQKYGRTFAQILLQRWEMGRCGEDIVILIVKQRPLQLVLNSKSQKPQNPIIFLNYGDEVQRRINAYDPMDLMEMLQEANKRLDDGFTVQEVLKRFMTSYKSLLEHADHLAYKPKSKHNIPNWALIIFGSCIGILFLLAIAQCLLKTSSRRGANRSKTSADSGRKWKAGFVGAMMLGMQSGSVIRPVNVLALIGGGANKQGGGGSGQML